MKKKKRSLVLTFRPQDAENHFTALKFQTFPLEKGD